MPRYLFSYGTLLPEFAPAEIAHEVRQLRHIGRGWIHGVLYDLGEYPGAVLTKTQDKVWGQLFVVPDDRQILNYLDQYEEFSPDDIGGSQFVRQECEVAMEGGEVIGAWVYVYNGPVDSRNRIAGGDFAEYRKVKGK